MMKDKYIEEELLEDIKLNIAISEFGKEYRMKSIKNEKAISFKKVAIIILGIIVITGAVQARNIVQSFINRKPVYIVSSISDAITDGYVENLNMEYMYSDGVGLKINSFSMSDNDISITFDFKLNGKTQLNGKNLEYAYIIYNENNEVYHVEKGTNTNLTKEFIKNNKVELVNNDIEPHFVTGQNMYVTKTEENVIVNSLISAKDYFPKAKKLYIKVVGIGYKNEKGNYKSLSNSEWNIELNVPEKFYLEKVIEYQLKEQLSKVNIERIIVSNTSMTFMAIIKEFNSGIDSKNSISVIDENGKEYATSAINFDSINKDKIMCKFPISKNMITSKMYLKMNIGGIEDMVELMKK